MWPTLLVDHSGDDKTQVIVGRRWLEQAPCGQREVDVLLPHDPTRNQEELVAAVTGDESVDVNPMVHHLHPVILGEPSGDDPAAYLLAVAEHAMVAPPNWTLEATVKSDRESIMETQPTAIEVLARDLVVRDFERRQADTGRRDVGAESD